MADLGCKNLMITGGEPLVCDNTISILEACQKFGINSQIITNGTIINEKLAKHIAKLTEMIGVSLDGSEPKINDLIRGHGNFEKTVSAIKILSSHLPVFVYFTASKINFDDMKNTIELAWSLGASGIHVSEIKISGRAEINAETLILSEKQKKYLKSFARKSLNKSQKLYQTCDADLSSLYMTSDGIVYVCTELSLCGNEMGIGNIRDQDLRKKIAVEINECKNNSTLQCCYDVYKGENVIFCLNNKNVCPKLLKVRR